MLEYIYYVRFLDNEKPYEEEMFNTFNEAKEFAMSIISKQPEICQTEVLRNDFGECVESQDLGILWSWKEVMSDIPEDVETVFNKADTFDLGDLDSEFDYSDEDIVFETDCVRPKAFKDLKTDKVVNEEMGELQAKFNNRLPALTKADFKTLLDTKDCIKIFYGDPCERGIRSRDYEVSYENGKYVVSSCDETYNDDFTDREEVEEFDTIDELWDFILEFEKEAHFFYPTYNYITESCELKPIPEAMSIKDLVEAMEENEDEVECTWCEDVYDKDMCRYEINLGWLCKSCQAAIKSRGETLTFRENDYWDFLYEDADKLKESVKPEETVELFYDNLLITVQSPKRDVDDWDEAEFHTDYTYEVPKEDVAFLIWEDFITDEDVADVEGGLEALEDDAAWEAFLATHFDDLFEKYYDQLLAHYKEDAVSECEEKTSWEDYKELGRSYWHNEAVETGSKNTFLEDLEEPEDYRNRLTMCPECGTDSFDLETGICINCGFN